MKKSYKLFLFFLIYPLELYGADFHGPRPFSTIMDSNFAKIWTPSVVSSISNSSHVILMDSNRQYCLSVTEGEMNGLQAIMVSSLSDENSTYGRVLRSMFQIQDLNIEKQSSSSLTYTYTIRPELKIYYAIDANSSSGVSSASQGIIRNIKAVDYSTISNPGYLVFSFNGSPYETSIRAGSRYIYNQGSAQFEQDTNWSPDHWLKIGESGVEIVNTEIAATSFMLVDSTGLLNVSNVAGQALNPASISWQTNSFATWPVNPSTSEIEVITLENSQLTGPNGMAYKDIDEQYRLQFGTSDDARSAASVYLSQIEAALLNAGESLRYDTSMYMTVRDNMLSHKFQALDEVNAVLGEQTIPFVFFTNAQDSLGKYHPFMVVGSNNGTGGPNFLIDVPRPPGDGLSADYSTQTITRNAVLSSSLIRIPLKDYGLVNTLTENDLSTVSSLASDAGKAIADYTVYNYASITLNGIAIDGVKIYPAMNNTLAFAQMNAEISSTGVHVGRGMGLHYHADGHSFNGNGLNLYNAEDYIGHSHPPVIGFSMDGLALYGKYESSYSTMNGYNEDIDEYGSHTHDGYGQHYHAHEKNVTGSWQNTPYSFTGHFLLVGAYKGKINDIPGFQDINTDQLKDSTLGKYVGLNGTYVTTSFVRVSASVLTDGVATGGNVTGTGVGLSGFQVTLEANASDGFVFDGWSGDITGTENPLPLTISSDIAVVANFSSDWTNVSDVAIGWKKTNWFGNYYENGDNWLYHFKIGWVYKSFINFTSWFYVPKLEAWAYTNQNIFPFMYDYNQQKWIYISFAGSDPLYYKYDNDIWNLF
jgi:hypothetical protein